jgi:hypothetical protein
MQLDSIGLLSKEASTVEYVVSDLVRTEEAMPDFSACPFSSIKDT